MSTVIICICTFKRPDLLSRCLASVAGIEQPAGVKVSVLVVDNDVDQSAAATVTALVADYGMPLGYVSEPRRGIPCARNRAVAEAVQASADYLVFIDDDETVTASWLQCLFDYGQSHGGQVVVHGRVIPDLPSSTPGEVAGLFGRNVLPTGCKLKTCATDNVLIPARVFRDPGLRFDESQPMAGGTDTKYFLEATLQGAEIYQCAEAVVYESIPEVRATLQWLARRKFRAGITDVWKKRKEGRSVVSVLLSACGRVIVDAVKTLVMLLLGRKLERNYYFLKMCKAAGLVAGAAGMTVDSYRVVDG